MMLTLHMKRKVQGNGMSFEINKRVPNKININPMARKKKKTESQKQEERVAKAIKGNKSKASGGSTCKSDCFNNFMRVECKSTEKKSLSIKRQWLEKITKEAHETLREPLFSFQFNETPQKWICMREDLFERIYEYITKDNDFFKRSL